MLSRISFQMVHTIEALYKDSDSCSAQRVGSWLVAGV